MDMLELVQKKYYGKRMMDIKLLTSLDQTVIDSIGGIAGWKNKDGEYIRVSTEAAKLVGWKTAREMEGKTDFDLPSKAAENAEEIQAFDKSLRDTKSSKTVFSIAQYADGDYHLLLGRDEVYSDKQGGVLGTKLNVIDISNTPISSFFLGILATDDKKSHSFKLSQHMYFIADDYHPVIKLTERETQCLFFTIRGASSKDIGGHLNISPRTVEGYLDAVRLKFNCKSKSELLVLALSMNLMSIIPKSFFQSM